ncbi:MAG: DUF493 domain-containing protein [Sulfuricella sp.]|nr:DUF493 domain-containing protein [Sulfuricella sp.]
METSLLEFPCDFPIKVMGETQDGFAEAMLVLVKRHAPDFDPATLEMRASKGGRYISLTFTVRAVSQAQLDALYSDITGHPMVVMAL